MSSHSVINARNFSMSLERSEMEGEHPGSLDTELDENQILELLSKLRLEIFQIETTTGPSRRTTCIRNEIKRLESQLDCCKDQAKERTEKVAHTKS